MNKINFIIGGLCLIVNILCGMVLSCYSAFNCGVTSGVIVLNMGILYLVSTINLKDAFRISLNCLFPIIAAVEFIIGLFAPEQFEDNVFLIFLLLALLFEGSILVLCNTISNKTK